MGKDNINGYATKDADLCYFALQLKLHIISFRVHDGQR
nr:MAG TPA: hypothetical protein [Bacteriophage sp.]